MHRPPLLRGRWVPTILTGAALLAALAACSDNNSVMSPVTSTTGFVETKLVADVATLGAAALDTNLVNPWGLAFGPTGILWVSNNHSGTSTLYDSTGIKQSRVVTIPSSGSSTGGAPTGIVFNPTSDFTIPGAGPALFIFAGEDGTISAWNASTPAAVLVADRSANEAVYKGLATASAGGANFLYATNFKQNSVDVFDVTFQLVRSFTDPGVPAGFAPFGIQNVGGQLYVTFAKQLPPDNEDDQPGAGNGYVDVFNADGTLAKRFASNGTLNSPWGIAIAPAGFGSFGGDILIGNFGDGRIGAYDPNTGNFLGLLQDATNAPIAIPGLWGLVFGPGASSTTLYFSAGPNDEADGLLGTLKAM
jgi:uncharacterized protein (TIGR03118 family)